MEQNLTKPVNAAALIHPDSGLTTQQERCALLLAAGERITDAANQVGTSRGTIYRWLASPAFSCFLNQAKQEILQYVEGSLMGLHQQALDVIKESLSSTREDLRFKASAWLIDKIERMQVGEGDVRRVIRQGLENQTRKEETWLDETMIRENVDAAYLRTLEESGMEIYAARGCETYGSTNRQKGAK